MEVANALGSQPPQLAIADLLVQHINTYDLFQKCQREFLDERPNYEITGEILQVEKYQSEQFSAAHLKMSFELYNYETNERIVVHSFDRETLIPPDNMTIFAKAISDMVNEEASNFLIKVINYFQPPKPDSKKADK